jgi:rare lipoprotein A
MVARAIGLLSGVVASVLVLATPAQAQPDSLAPADAAPAAHRKPERSRQQPRAGRRATLARQAAAAHTKVPHLPPGSGRVLEIGTASWYGKAWRGRRTASGVPFDDNALTAAAHRSLPLGSRVRVQLIGSTRYVDVTITDRLSQPGRVIDLSKGAARQLGIVQRGTAPVALTEPQAATAQPDTTEFGAP